MNKFKVGDKVRRIAFCECHPSCCEGEIPVGTVTTIREIKNQKRHPYLLEIGSHTSDESELELVEPATDFKFTINPDFFRSVAYKPFLLEPLIARINASNKPKQTFIKTMIYKTTEAFKKFISPDLQAQVKAGFRYSEGFELTEAGKTAAIEALLDATPAAQTAFVAAAAEIVAEQEKQK